MDAPAWSLKARWVLPVLTPPVENGVIEIAGVGPINGDQREIPQINASLDRDGPCSFRLAQGGCGEVGRNVV
jgi:hypothetical protein